jgi:hypothetical protein
MSSMWASRNSTKITAVDGPTTVKRKSSGGRIGQSDVGPIALGDLKDAAASLDSAAVAFKDAIMKPKRIGMPKVALPSASTLPVGASLLAGVCHLTPHTSFVLVAVSQLLL